ncbi:MAG: ABC transporter ATP-binding protein [Myxococcales bacterium]|nr:ABC transporter ATP-binding protein [Myxococcales bacterium]MCB9580950.1 ABC transporter ATP-binding protein [Polyangiaceae bacterium]
MASAISIKGLTRHFPDSEKPAVDQVDLEVAAGEIVSLVGPSGCGKSTTLRLIAGLDVPDAGSIRIGERDVAKVPPQERDVAMVFQGFALYPHMKVRDIMAFPLKMRKVPAAERDKSVAETAELLGIEKLLDRRPAQLSGGEQQRVAMGRAIVRKPAVFLFDEPLSNLDAALRAELRVELGKLLRRLGVTALYVTHDQAEAMTLSDRIVLLRAGRIEQIDKPRDIYERPETAFAAAFFGSPPMNLLEADASDGRARAGSIELDAPSGAELLLGVRPEHVRVGAEASGSVRAEGSVTVVELLGGESHLELDAGGVTVRARVPGFEAPAVGSTVPFAFDASDVVWFDRGTGRAL